ncbi:MAG: YibE/F family protein, partial [Peptococcaceae bacterium]|nr:YibE/F family protein [Peptococcaceae bacterium]
DQRMVYKLEIDPGDQVLIYLERDQQGNILNAYISDIYRQNYLMLLLILFLLALVALGGWKGLKTIVTLFLTGIAIVKFLLPGLLAGYSPILLTVVICAVVTALTLLIVSGTGRKTLAAILGTTGGVLMAGIIAYIFGSVTKLTGLGDEQTQMLAFIPQGTGFDYQGLLFAGIILGSLGAIMDVGISIASAMSEIEAVKPDIKNRDLFKAALNVGRDVMGTMSNTLILAYTGASLSLLLLFLAHQTPVQEFLNWDMIATEIVRALAGSIGLILTVPLTALVTVAFRPKKAKRNN